jgi:hypothetical protein
LRVPAIDGLTPTKKSFIVEAGNAILIINVRFGSGAAIPAWSAQCPLCAKSGH